MCGATRGGCAHRGRVHGAGAANSEGIGGFSGTLVTSRREGHGHRTPHAWGWCLWSDLPRRCGPARLLGAPTAAHPSEGPRPQHSPLRVPAWAVVPEAHRVRAVGEGRLLTRCAFPPLTWVRFGSGAEQKMRAPLVLQERQPRRRVGFRHITRVDRVARTHAWPSEPPLGGVCHRRGSRDYRKPRDSTTLSSCLLGRDSPQVEG